MLAMLLQSMLGLADDEIVSDYFESNQLREASAAIDTVRKRGRLDRNVFSGTNRQAMVDTLRFLRTKYGSVSPGYLDAIGFWCTVEGTTIGCPATSFKKLFQQAIANRY